MTTVVEPAVALDRIAKDYGSVPAVKGVSLTVARGEIYGLLGPNGAGKTTALRIVAGLLAPSRGRCAVAGIDVAQEPLQAKARIGFMSLSTGLYARLTAREFLAYFGRLHGMPPNLVERRTGELASALGLGRLLDRLCETFSTGEKQRVSLARTVLHDPLVLVLDEPTSGLDVLASRFLRDFVRSERARGKAVLFSTHYLAEAELLCDRVGLLFQGSLIREGTPVALRADAGASSLEEAFLTFVGAATP